MNIQELVFKYVPLVKKNWLPLALGILGMIFFTYGLIGLFAKDKSASDEVVFEASSANQNQLETKLIIVDIEGAVVKPGLYKLPQDARVQDGLVAAGGLSESADRDYIAKNLNLATKLIDGAKVYIPNIGEAVNAASVLNAMSEGVAVASLININTSSQSQLETLVGIGPVTAQKIIGARPYSSVDELLSKKIVGSSVFGQIKDKITVY